MATAADDRAATERSVLSLVRDHLEHVMRACTRTSRALADRERVVSLPVESAAKALLQGRLFDRRAVRAERERARVAAAILDEADRRLAALDARTRLTPSLTLTALLLVEDRTTR
jgi:hypothetical protein